MVNDITSKLVQFRFGTKAGYGEALSEGRVVDSDIYYVSDSIEYNGIQTELSNLCIGKNIVGDSYNSSYSDNLSKPVTNQIGLIRYGMPLGMLMNETGGSISKIIDMMLFTGEQPTVDEFSIIAGILPSQIYGQDIDSNIINITEWISAYASKDFSEERYNRFLSIRDTVDTILSISPSQDESALEYGQDTGQYTGRVFFAVPTDGQGQSVEISSIVDKVFPQNTYAGTGIKESFVERSVKLDFGSLYDYELYIFSTDQHIVTRLNLEYSVELS